MRQSAVSQLFVLLTRQCARRWREARFACDIVDSSCTNSHECNGKSRRLLDFFRRRSDLRFPALLVLARPELHGVCVTGDAAVLRVALQRAAGPMGDVAEVTQQRTLVAIENL